MTLLPNIPTGCKSIDNALGGGIPPESVSLIYGEAETGKTTLSIQCAVNCAEMGYKTLFVDCDATFSAHRLSQIASGGLNKIAEYILLMKPSNFHEQGVVIDHMAEYITKNFGLVIFDTITSLYRSEVSEHPEKTFKLNRELNRQVAALAQVAKTHKIAVLMTSQVRSVINDIYAEVEPVGTRVLKFWADTIIAMKPTENSKIIKVLLEKTPKETSRKSQPLTCYLRIDEKGISENSPHQP
ncbi:MAG: ATPase domain-containing protein [Candidatus Bathyarchaeia archaeon]